MKISNYAQNVAIVCPLINDKFLPTAICYLLNFFSVCKMNSAKFLQSAKCNLLNKEKAAYLLLNREMAF